jgi:hypothetical protein
LPSRIPRRHHCSTPINGIVPNQSVLRESGGLVQDAGQNGRDASRQFLGKAFAQ